MNRTRPPIHAIRSSSCLSSFRAAAPNQPSFHHLLPPSPPTVPPPSAPVVWAPAARASDALIPPPSSQRYPIHCLRLDRFHGACLDPRGPRGPRGLGTRELHRASEPVDRLRGPAQVLTYAVPGTGSATAVLGTVPGSAPAVRVVLPSVAPLLCSVLRGEIEVLAEGPDHASESLAAGSDGHVVEGGEVPEVQEVPAAFDGLAWGSVPGSGVVAALHSVLAVMGLPQAARTDRAGTPAL